MGIIKAGYKEYVVWDKVGNFAHFIGSYEQCKQYIEEHE